MLKRVGGDADVFGHQLFAAHCHGQPWTRLRHLSHESGAQSFMFADDPVPLLQDEERTVSENHTGRRFKTLAGELNERFKYSRPMIVRSDCEVDEDDGVPAILVRAPVAVRGEFPKGGWNFVWVASNIEPDAFKNSS